MSASFWDRVKRLFVGPTAEERENMDHLEAALSQLPPKEIDRLNSQLDSIRREERRSKR